MSVKELTSSEFDTETKKGKSVVDFWAEWCGPCKMSKPIFEAVSSEVKDIHFFSVNVDNNPDIPGKFGVMGIPTFIVLKDGKEVDRIVGYLEKDTFKERLVKAFK
ncbi:MAG: thioredoxin [Nanoarchaeota archaeon]